MKTIKTSAWTELKNLGHDSLQHIAQNILVVSGYCPVYCPTTNDYSQPRNHLFLLVNVEIRWKKQLQQIRNVYGGESGARICTNRFRFLDDILGSFNNHTRIFRNLSFILTGIDDRMMVDVLRSTQGRQGVARVRSQTLRHTFCTTKCPC